VTGTAGEGGKGSRLPASRKPLLAPGDTVGVVATGFAPRPGALRSGLRRLERMGLRVARGPSLGSRDGYLAGTDRQRVTDLNEMLRRDDVRGLWFARGGYGTARILEDVDWRALRRRSKPMVGYSDLTALFCAVLTLPRRICLYGPVVAELGQPGSFHLASLRTLLRGDPVGIRFTRRQVVAEGAARGRLLGGNLSVLVHLLGTRWAPRLDGCVLLLEDVGEETYRLDRLLTQLRASGALSGVRAVVLGSLEPAAPGRTFPPDRPLAELVRETFCPLGVPVVSGLPVGHLPAKRTVPLGGRAELDTAAGT